MSVVSAVFLTALAVADDAGGFRFDQSSARLEFEGSYGGEPVPGRFHRFSGVADFDLANPLAARFRVEIDVSSLDTEYPDRDEVLKDADWFAIARHPTATWVSTGACAPSGTRWRCPGALTLRGITRPVPIEVGAEGAAVVGSARVDRREFGVGAGEWDDPATIADTVTVRFRLAPAAD